MAEKPAPNPAKSTEAKTRANGRQGNVREWIKITIEAATLLAVIWYAVVASGQLTQMRNATKAAKRSADAAARAAAIDAEQLDLSERPWLAVKATPIKPGLWWVKRSQAALQINVSISNVGKSIAKGIQVSANLVPMPPGLPIAVDAAQRERSLCSHDSPGGAGWFDLFPTDRPAERRLSISATTPAVAAQAVAPAGGDSHSFVGLYVVGCVSYLSSYSTQVHHTDFAYQLVAPPPTSPAGKPILLPDGLPVMGFQVGTDVPPSKLGWMQELLAPNDAD